MKNAEGGAAVIAANTWTEIKGTILSSTTRTWAGPDFVNNQLPTVLDGVSVTIGGKKAFVYYISPTQIDVLTPPDLGAGTQQVVVQSGTASSAPFAAQVQQSSPSFFVINGGPSIGTVVGSPSVFPGTTPAAPGETIVLYANGFGATTVPVVSGALTQSGTLPTLPVITIGGGNAVVAFAGLISPGLFQFNVTVPSLASDGDNGITAAYGGQTTQTGALITIQR